MIVVDVETTEFDPAIGSIINIGAVDFANPKNQFFVECKVPRNAKIHPSCLPYTGHTKEEIFDEKRKEIKEALQDFLKWMEGVKDKTIAGHNVYFDLLWLKNEAKRANVSENFGKRIIDLHSICYTDALTKGLKIPLKDSYSALYSDTVMEYVGLPAEPKPHKKGITGAIYETEAFFRLLYGKGLLEEFTEYEVPDYLIDQNINI